MLSVQDLGGAWTLRAMDPTILDGRDIPATVPGCVHIDLLEAGLIPDPFQDRHELDVQWVGRADWTYSRPFSWDGTEHERVDLVFEGLDTVADVSVGGVPLGSTRNMHRSYRFDVTALAYAGTQELNVGFTSAYTEAERVQEKLGPRPNAYPEPFNFVRKMACSFGWDWGPTLVTAGIWRPVRLEGWSTARLATVLPLATWSDGAGHLSLTIETERTRDIPLQARILLDGQLISTVDLDTRTPLHLPIAYVRPWHPTGHGDQPLYDLTVELTAAGEVLDRWQRRTGFRTGAIDRDADETGHRFLLQINGSSVLGKGVNWIPDDIFPSRMTRERYARRLGEAAAAGVNLIRVWGGGIYESRDFYEVCDELGLMVWQDFLFACACYPEEEPLYSEVVAEARENVTRLAAHPSLITWNGNNENLWLHGADGWAVKPGGDKSWGENYYLRTLPAIVAQLDPSRPYQAGSPWSGSWRFAPNDTDHGTFHSWDVWNRQDYTHYRDSAPRFVAEFGWQAPPAWRTLRDSVSDEPLAADSPGVLHHQKAGDGNGKLARGLASHFPEPSSVEAWHYVNQLNQVRAIRTGVEHWRSYWPHTGGTILWQLNDLWPVTSWAAIDGAGRYKPLYHLLGELYAQRAVTIQPRGDGLVVAVLNDSPAAWSGEVELARIDTRGHVLASARVEVSAGARSVATIPVPSEVARFGAAAAELITVRLDGERALWYGVPETEFDFGDSGLTISAEPQPGGLAVTVRAEGLARDVLLQADRMHPDAVADRGFLTLLPGESATIRVTGAPGLDPALIKAPWVLTDLGTVLSLRGGEARPMA